MRPTPDLHRHDRLLAAALLWLFGGSVLLLSTLVPAYNELFGWGPLFWLVGAPLAVLFTLKPGLPRLLLALAMAKPRRKRNALIWP